MKKAILIDASVNKEDTTIRYREMYNLLEGLEIEVIGEAFQELKEINKATYIGKGKIMEVKDLIEKSAESVDMVICNFDLKSLQYKNLKDMLDIEILDRTGVILQIFALRAQTKEAKLQVETATLEYLKARLVSKDANYSQVTSGGAGGLANRGSGEKQIDLDRYKFRNLLKRKKDELEMLVKQREQNRRNRVYYPVVAIVGYTNAGKSSLMNRFLEVSKVSSDKKVREENRLFATLETSTRLIDLNDYPTFLLTDTVGFIDNLPTTLIKAFRSTLEEIKDADILIHVVDVSEQDYQSRMDVTTKTLSDIGVKDIPTIYLYNKVDLLQRVPFVPDKHALFTSLNMTEDMEQVVALICETLAEKWQQADFDVTYATNIYDIKKHGYVTSLLEKEDGYHVQGYFPEEYIKRLKLL